MTKKLLSIAKALHPARLSSIADYLLKDEAISGKLILGAVALALIAANSPLAPWYQSFWHTNFTIGLGDWSLALDLRHWVSDALMVFFFLVVGLELRRELTSGELQDHRTAILPFGAALGGMIVPALIYVAFNAGSASLGGWAIPMATDIALAIGILALLGKKIPSSIRIFLLTLAIVDDVAAVVVIALFYSSGINLAMLFIGIALITLLFLLRRTKYMVMPLYIALGLVLWLVTYRSGVHASITGAILGLLAPTVLRKNNSSSIAVRMEKATIPFSTLLVVPIFAFANTGLSLSDMHFEDGSTLNIAGGIIAGLVIGKVLGIFGASWAMIKLGIADLPTRSTWTHILGVGLLAGIGFTVAIFVTELAFNDEQLIAAAKVCIFIASAVSAVLGFVTLRFINNKTEAK